jgi:hypothetical protein
MTVVSKMPTITALTPVPTGERCCDAINIRIPQKQFLEMYDGYMAYKTSPKIHLNQATKVGDYISNAYFVKNMLPRWITYKKSHNNIRPAAIWTVHVPTPVNPLPVTKPKPQLLLDVEKVLGGIINSATDFYNLVRKMGKYAHYTCVQKTLSVAINAMTHAGDNCADWSNIGEAVLKALIQWGKHYFYTVAHVDCKKSSGADGEGHFFLFVKGEEFNSTVNYDLAEAASGARPVGSTMCTYGFRVIGSKLC